MKIDLTKYEVEAVLKWLDEDDIVRKGVSADPYENNVHVYSAIHKLKQSQRAQQVYDALMDPEVDNFIDDGRPFYDEDDYDEDD